MINAETQKRIYRAALKDVDLHVNEMKLKSKWYNKLFSLCKTYMGNIVVFLYYTIFITVISIYLIEHTVFPLFVFFVSHFPFISLIAILDELSENDQKDFLKCFIFKGLKNKYKKTFDNYMNQTLTLNSIKNLSINSLSEDMKALFNQYDGEVKYKDIFSDKVSVIYKELENKGIEYKRTKAIEFKKGKANDLIDRIYQDMNGSR